MYLTSSGLSNREPESGGDAVTTFASVPSPSTTP
jgi:hypothetical protein